MASGAEYNLRTQAKIPAALAALHNFIRVWDPEDMPDADDDNDLDTEISEDREETLIPPENLGSNISQAERLRAAAKRDGIAKAMWDQYQEERRIRGEI